MFLIDNILLLPARGVLWIARELDNAAQQAFADEAEAITIELSQLYTRLENGQLTEAEFDAREKELLDHLDALQERETAVASEEEEEEGTNGQWRIHNNEPGSTDLPAETNSAASLVRG